MQEPNAYHFSILILIFIFYWHYYEAIEYNFIYFS